MINNDLFLSILIPNYNKSSFIRDTLNSILEQIYQNWECIIVDDHSTDDSWEILKEFSLKDSRIKIFRRPLYLPKGGNSCRNFAFEKSKGKFIQWFDSDDIMLKKCLSNKISEFANLNENTFVVSTAIIKYEPGYSGNGFTQNLNFSNLISDYLKFKIQFLPGGPLFPRYIFEKVGLFNLSLKRHQEWELFLRVLLNYPDFKVLDSAGFIYRINNNSITSEYDSFIKSVLADLNVFRVLLDDSSNPFVHKIPKNIQNYFALKKLKLSFKLMKVGYMLFFFKVIFINKIYSS